MTPAALADTPALATGWYVRPSARVPDCACGVCREVARQEDTERATRDAALARLVAARRIEAAMAEVYDHADGLVQVGTAP